MASRLRLLLVAGLLVTGGAPALAQGHLRWVEVELALDGDGRAQVTYQVRWATSGTMHGFYFQGEGAPPRFRGDGVHVLGARLSHLRELPAAYIRYELPRGQAGLFIVDDPRGRFEPAGREVQVGPQVPRVVNARGVIVTAACTEGPYDFVSRFFGPAVGIDEDRVTGTAHSVLGP